MDIKSIIGYLPALAGLLGSGPWGVAAVFGAIAMVGGAVLYMIKKGNSMRDSADLEAGGADAGKTSTDLRNQANSNRDYLNEQEAIIRKEER